MNQYKQLAHDIKLWGQELGFQQVGISDINLSQAEVHFVNWLNLHRHGNMDYMEKHGIKRCRPADLIPGTISVISTRMDYFPVSTVNPEEILHNSQLAYISRYALGKDYHKVMRKRLQKLVNRIVHRIDNFNYRVFTDSAPILEKALAEKAGLGWIGKHSNIINQQCGSWFFLGEIYTDLPLPADSHSINHCGTCQACIEACPTQAIVAPYEVDARLCISYLTIELRESIPVELRPLIGNRIYGCDDCQLVCPWNKFARPSREPAFSPRQPLEAPDLIELFLWTETSFLHNTEGSAIRRIGYECWLRNIAVALGNASPSQAIFTALTSQLNHPSPLVKEHVLWALQLQTEKLKNIN